MDVFSFMIGVFVTAVMAGIVFAFICLSSVYMDLNFPARIKSHIQAWRSTRG